MALAKAAVDEPPVTKLVIAEVMAAPCVAICSCAMLVRRAGEPPVPEAATATLDAITALAAASELAKAAMPLVRLAAKDEATPPVEAAAVRVGVMAAALERLTDVPADEAVLTADARAEKMLALEDEDEVAPAAARAVTACAARDANWAEATSRLVVDPPVAMAVAMGSTDATLRPKGRPRAADTLAQACAAVSEGLAAMRDCATVLSGERTVEPAGADRGGVGVCGARRPR